MSSTGAAPAATTAHQGIAFTAASYVSDCLAEPAPTQTFDAVSCSFGLSDIDDLDSCIGTVGRSLRPGGRFVFSLLHPCFAGGGEISGSWPSGRTYFDEGRWMPEGRASSIRRQVGANHRMLSSYVSALTAHQLQLDALVEPPPPKE